MALLVVFEVHGYEVGEAFCAGTMMDVPVSNGYATGHHAQSME